LRAGNSLAVMDVPTGYTLSLLIGAVPMDMHTWISAGSALVH